MDLDLDLRIRGLEQFGDSLRARQHERGVPDDLAFLLRGLEMRARRLGVAASGEARHERDRDGDGEAHGSRHHRWFSGVRAAMRSLRLGAAASPFTATMIASTPWAGSASPALPRNFATI